MKNRKRKPIDMNVVELWKKKKAQKRNRNTYLRSINKDKKKRLASKPVSPVKKPALSDKPSDISINVDKKTALY